MCVATLLTPIRLYSTNWISSNDKLIKQVVYDPTLRFKPFKSWEHDNMRKLPIGFVYAATLENNTIVYNPLESID